MTKLRSHIDAAGSIPETAAGGILHIDLDALASNWRILRDNAGGADTAAVVKANAYGIGIEKAVPALARAGCRPDPRPGTRHNALSAAQWRFSSPEPTGPITAD